MMLQSYYIYIKYSDAGVICMHGYDLIKKNLEVMATQTKTDAKCSDFELSYGINNTGCLNKKKSTGQF